MVVRAIHALDVPRRTEAGITRQLLHSYSGCRTGLLYTELIGFSFSAKLSGIAELDLHFFCHRGRGWVVLKGINSYESHPLESGSYLLIPTGSEYEFHCAGWPWPRLHLVCNSVIPSYEQDGTS